MNLATCIDPKTCHVRPQAAAAPIKPYVVPKLAPTRDEKRLRFLACLRGKGKARAELIASCGLSAYEVDRQIYSGMRMKSVTFTGTRRHRVYHLA